MGLIFMVLGFDRWADSVLIFAHGDGQWFGQGEYPAVVLGAPDTSADPLTPSLDVLSLGQFGFIILQFRDNVVVDGPGDDLVIFENSFITSVDSGDTSVFAEPAYVFLSRDGRFFFLYPFDTSDSNPYNWTGLAGIKPTNYGADTSNPDVWMGDRFDISLVGLDTVRFVLIADAVDLCPSSLCSGFDLDAAGCLNCAYGTFEDSLRFPVMAAGFGADTSLYTSLLSVDGVYTPLGYEGLVIYRLENGVPNVDGYDLQVRATDSVRLFGGLEGFMNAFYGNSLPFSYGEIDSLLSRDVQPPFYLSDTVYLLGVRSVAGSGVDGVVSGPAGRDENWFPEDGEVVEIYSAAGKLLYRGEFGLFRGDGLFIVRGRERVAKVLKKRR